MADTDIGRAFQAKIIVVAIKEKGLLSVPCMLLKCTPSRDKQIKVWTSILEHKTL